MLKAASYMWSASTVALMLLVFLLPMWLFRQAAPSRWEDGAWIWEITPGSLFARKWSGAWAGVTFGWAILFSPGYSLNIKTASHERVHVRQSLWLGPFYLPAWLILTLFFGYANNPMEAYAYKHQINKRD